MMIVRLRTQQLLIDLPTPDSEPWLNIIVQRVEMDDEYNTLNVVDRWGRVTVPLSSIQSDIYPIADPLNPPAGLVSVAGLADTLTSAAVAEIIKKYGGYVDDNGFIILE